MKVEFGDVLLKVRINGNNGSIYTCCALLHVSEWEQISLGVFFLSLSQPIVQVFFYRTKEPFYYNPTLCSCMDNKSFSQYDDPKQFLYCSLLGG